MSHVETKEVTYLNGHRIVVGGKTYSTERACLVECYPPGSEDSAHHEVCSECGTVLTSKKPEERHWSRARYCPNCGAKVIGE